MRFTSYWRKRLHLTENRTGHQHLTFRLSFSDWNSVDSIEFVEKYIFSCFENDNY